MILNEYDCREFCLRLSGVLETTDIVEWVYFCDF